MLDHQSSVEELHSRASGLPEVCWQEPLPLQGVKSRRRAIFEVPKAYFKSNCEKSINTFSYLKLSLESRVAAIGSVGRAAPELLLGSRKLVTGNIFRHDGLSVLHLGPHLISGAMTQSVGSYLAAASCALAQRPHVVVLDEAAEALNEAWSQAFSFLLGSEAMLTFRGALVICVAEETPAIKQICGQRWTGAAEWLWQEDIKDDEGLEFLEDVLSLPGDGVLHEAFFQELRALNQVAFCGEDIMEAAKAKGWTLTVLTSSSSSSSKSLPKGSSVLHSESEESSYNGIPEHCPVTAPDTQLDKADGGRSLAGFMCYYIRPGEVFHVARIAVPEPLRSAGHGRRMMRWALEKAAQKPISEVAWLELSALDTAVPFYERFGFVDMTSDDVDSGDHFSTWMEMPNRSVVAMELSVDDE